MGATDTSVLPGFLGLAAVVVLVGPYRDGPTLSAECSQGLGDDDVGQLRDVLRGGYPYCDLSQGCDLAGAGAFPVAGGLDFAGAGEQFAFRDQGARLPGLFRVAAAVAGFAVGDVVGDLLHPLDEQFHPPVLVEDGDGEGGPPAVAAAAGVEVEVRVALGGQGVGFGGGDDVLEGAAQTGRAVEGERSTVRGGGGLVWGGGGGV